MFYIESSNVLRAIFVDLADCQPFNDEIDCDDPARFISECLNDGLIESCDALPFVERRYKKPELQVFCKQFGLKSSGTKFELVQRLKTGNPEWYEAEIGNCRFWKLTEFGESVAMRLAGEIGKESGEMEALLTELLLAKKVTEAWETWSAWNDLQPWPITPENQSSHETGYRPYSREDFEWVCSEAMMALPAGDAATFLAGLLMGRYMLYEQSEFTKRNQEYRTQNLLNIRSISSAIGLRVHESRNCHCVFSKAYAGDYRLEDAPLIPSSLCTNEPCCTCFTTAIFDHDDVKDGLWKTPIRRHPDAGPVVQREMQPLSDAGIRRLAEAMNNLAGTNIVEEDIRQAVENARARGELVEEPKQEMVEQRPQGIWSRIKSLFGSS